MSTDIQKEWESGNLIPPAVNIYDTGEEYVLMANMPGVKKDDLNVKFADGELVIHGKLANEYIAPDAFVHREIEDGNYYRIFKVSDTVDATKISAKLTDGILILKLPRYERSKPKVIPIEVV